MEGKNDISVQYSELNKCAHSCNNHVYHENKTFPQCPKNSLGNFGGCSFALIPFLTPTSDAWSSFCYCRLLLPLPEIHLHGLLIKSLASFSAYYLWNLTMLLVIFHCREIPAFVYLIVVEGNLGCPSFELLIIEASIICMPLCGYMFIFLLVKYLGEEGWVV